MGTWGLTDLPGHHDKLTLDKKITSKSAIVCVRLVLEKVEFDGFTGPPQ